MKTYITEIIGDDYWSWKSEKIFIEAPTGSGKTTFIVQQLLKAYRQRGQKLLILCNRRLLRDQYWGDLVESYESYEELQNTVDVKTYQELAMKLINGAEAESLLKEYAGICMDEVHFFYADSDFNGYGTYVLLQKLLKAGLKHQMVFISATMECVKPWIQKIIGICERNIPLEEQFQSYPESCFRFKEYAMPDKDIYSHVQCIAIPDFETLCEKIGHAKGKSIIFYDDKAGANMLYELLQSRGGLKADQITRLNADNMDNGENSKVVKELVMANKLMPKVLLTTSVLDNGVSVHDPDVESVTIITESKVSFLQMLGRVRTESVQKLKLYLLVRPASFFEKRTANLERTLEAFDVHGTGELYYRQLEILESVWSGQSERAEAYRKAFVLYSMEEDLLHSCSNQFARITYGRLMLTINLFAKHKLGDLYLEEAKYCKLAKKNPIKILYRQMAWMNKSADELEIQNSTFLEEQNEKLKETLQQIQNFTKEQLAEKKKEIAEKFGKNVLSDYKTKNQPFSQEKLKRMLEQFSLKLVEKMVDNKKQYSVVPRTEREEVDTCC